MADMPGDFSPVMDAASAMVDFRRPWCVAGGWAIDLWLGRVTRNHRDVDIAVLRDHQLELREHLSAFAFRIATTQDKLVPWKDPRQMLMLPVHELHVSDKATGRAFEILLNESDGIDWVYRRNFEVRLNLAGWVWHGVGNIPILNPLIVLLYKSTSPGPKDELDFSIAVERLSEQQRTWLQTALLRTDADHRWLDRLSD